MKKKLLWIIIIVLIIALGGYTYVNSLIDDVIVDEGEADDIFETVDKIEEELISEVEAAEIADLDEVDAEALEALDKHIEIDVDALPDDEVYNIILFGLDTRFKESFKGRSDAIALISFNITDKTIVINSFMRDLLVKIPGRGKDKLTHAYAYDGPDLAVETLEKNFGLQIDNYVVVNFNGMESIINKMGGIKVEIASNEVSALNTTIIDQNVIAKTSSKASKVSKSGLQKLTGRQAVAYSRIRSIGGDSGRTKRQRKVLVAIFNKLTSLGVTDAIKLINPITKYVRTDIEKNEIIDMAKMMFSLKEVSPQSFKIPSKGKGQRYKGRSVVVADLALERQVLIDRIYGEEEQ